MKIKWLSLLAFGVAVTATVPAAATVIDFNSPPASGSHSYTVSGVTFTTVTPTGTLQFETAPNGTTGFYGNAESGVFPELRADFLSALTGNISVDLGDYGADADTLFLQLFDSSSTSLGFTSLLTLSSDYTMHTLTLGGSNISYALFGSRSPSVAGSSVFADNFTFSTQTEGAVPEPATWTMMLLGFGGVGIAMRRNRRRLAKPVLA